METVKRRSTSTRLHDAVSQKAVILVLCRFTKFPWGRGGGALVRFGDKFSGGWTKGLLLVENSMTHQGVTLLHTA
jgi:hypothetical protein